MQRKDGVYNIPAFHIHCYNHIAVLDLQLVYISIPATAMTDLLENEMFNTTSEEKLLPSQDEEQRSNGELQNHHVREVTSPSGPDPENLERPSRRQDATPTNAGIYLLLNQIRSEVSLLRDLVAKLSEGDVIRRSEDNSSDRGYDSYSEDDYSEDSYSNGEYDKDKSEDDESSDAYSEVESGYVTASTKRGSRGRFPIAIPERARTKRG